MKKAYSEIKFYAHKYPWVFYYGMISIIASFFLRFYEELKTLISPMNISIILPHILVSIFWIFIFALAFGLFAKYILDRHCEIGNKGYVYYPAMWFAIFLVLQLISGFTLFQKAFIDAVPFVNVKSIYIAQFVKAIFLLLVNIVLFGLYRKKD